MDVHCGKVTQSETCCSIVLVPCRYFVLKQGKIFWFKSDVVTPVSACTKKSFSLFNATAEVLVDLQDSIPRGVIEVRMNFCTTSGYAHKSLCSHHTVNAACCR